MRYRGREIDPIGLWENYVEFPSNLKVDHTFLPRVVCPNPFHDTTKKHFQINVDQPLVHCFAGCGISGSYEHALAVIHGLYDEYKVEEAADDKEKNRRIRRARKATRKYIFKHKSTANFTRKRSITKAEPKSIEPLSLDRDVEYERFIPQAGLDYLTSRKISAKSIAKWEIGWDSENLRLVFPARDMNGTLRFVQKRTLKAGGSTKYLNMPPEVSKTSLLFGACHIDPGMVRYNGLILVEGVTDTIIWHQHGLQNTGGILGTGISEAQRRIVARMRPPRIYFAFDKDSAGITNIEIAARKLRKYPIFIVRFPKGKNDPGELSKREAWRAIERAMPLSLFIRELHERGISLNIRPTKGAIANG